MADIFEAVINAEERLHLKGFKEGAKHGRLEGMVDGFSTGQLKGVEFGDEIGYYLGFAEVMLDMMKSKEGGDKLKRLLSSLIEQIKGFSCLDFTSASYLEDLDKLRAKFKQVNSILKVRAEDRISSKFSF